MSRIDEILKKQLEETEKKLRTAGRMLHRLGLVCYDERRYVAAQKLFTFRDQIVEIADQLVHK